MVFSGYMLGVGLLDHMVALFLVFLRNFQIVLHSGCAKLRSHQQCRKVSFSLHSLQHLLFVNLLKISILTGLRWSIPHCCFDLHLSNSDFEELFMCLLVICMSLEKCLGLPLSFSMGCLFFSVCIYIYIFFFSPQLSGCFFALFLIFFAIQIFLRLIRSHLCSFYFQYSRHVCMLSC